MSGGQNDSGVFELNFRDERYLPFEGAGVISSWRIELPDPNLFCQFNYDTISDVIFHVSYTAREGGEALKNAAKDELKTAINAMNLADDRTGLIQLFSAKHNFPAEWHRFLNPTGDTLTQILELDLKDRFPHLFRNMTIAFNTAHILLKLRERLTYDDSKFLAFDLIKGDHQYPSQGLKIAGSPIYELPHECFEKLNVSEPFEKLEKWFIELNEEPYQGQEGSEPRIEPNLALLKTVNIDGEQHYRLIPEAIEDLLIVFQYSVDFSKQQVP
jgi:hypothetical protein